MSDDLKPNGDRGDRHESGRLETSSALSELRALAEEHEFKLRSSQKETTLGTDENLARLETLIAD